MTLAKSIAMQFSKVNSITYRRNKRIVDYCINTYQLLFLGNLAVSLDTSSMLKSSSNDANFQAEYKELEKSISYANAVDMTKSTAQSPYAWRKASWFCDIKPQINEIACCYVHESNDIVVSNEIMEYEFRHWGFSNKLTKDEKMKRVLKLLKFAYHYAEIDHINDLNIEYMPNIFQITRATLDNTRNLLDAGLCINFSQWNDPIVVNSILKSKKKLLNIRIAHDGDNGDTCVYDELCSGDLHNISGVEILCCTN